MTDTWAWWRLYFHVLIRFHRMCVVELDDHSFHYFCSCGHNNDGVTLAQMYARFNFRGEED